MPRGTQSLPRPVTPTRRSEAYGHTDRRAMWRHRRRCASIVALLSCAEQSPTRPSRSGVPDRARSGDADDSERLFPTAEGIVPTLAVIVPTDRRGKPESNIHQTTLVVQRPLHRSVIRPTPSFTSMTPWDRLGLWICCRLLPTPINTRTSSAIVIVFSPTDTTISGQSVGPRVYHHTICWVRVSKVFWAQFCDFTIREIPPTNERI